MIFSTRFKNAEKLLKGKTLFFRFYGNFHHMQQEGVYGEYKRMKIPAHIETKWREEILKGENQTLQSKATVYEKILCVQNLLNCGAKTKDVAHLILDLLSEKMDTFSRLLLCEELKRLTLHETEITSVLEIQKLHMLNENITIDEKYFQLPHMKDYDFSNDSVRKRINAL